MSVVDYFSGEILVNSLVWPNVPMYHYNTAFTGIRPEHLESAKRNGTCLWGRNGARAVVLRFVGLDTIVVGHALQNDLNALRWIHPVVVDSLILELQSAQPGAQTKRRAMALKTLARERLGRHIQRKTHDSTEDAVAARDLIHWHVTKAQHPPPGPGVPVAPMAAVVPVAAPGQPELDSKSGVFTVSMPSAALMPMANPSAEPSLQYVAAAAASPVSPHAELPPHAQGPQAPEMAGNTQMRLELYGYHQQSTAEVYEMPSGSVA